MKFRKIKYADLNARQKETYNYQKACAILADYGFACMLLNDDWQGADFIAQHIDGRDYLKVQLKSRLTFDKKYIGKNLYICFPNGNDWYFYPHDIVLKWMKTHSMMESGSWTKGTYSFNRLSKKMLALLADYRL